MSHLQFTSLHWLIVGSDECRDGLDKMQPWQGQSRRASLCSWLPGQGEFLPVPWLSCKSSLCRFVVCLRCEVKHVSLNLTERLRKARFYSAFAACQAMVTCWCDSSHLIDTFYWCSIFAQYFQRLLRLVICFSLFFFFGVTGVIFLSVSLSVGRIISFSMESHRATLKAEEDIKLKCSKW